MNKSRDQESESFPVWGQLWTACSAYPIIPALAGSCSCSTISDPISPSNVHQPYSINQLENEPALEELVLALGDH